MRGGSMERGDWAVGSARVARSRLGSMEDGARDGCTSIGDGESLAGKRLSGLVRGEERRPHSPTKLSESLACGLNAGSESRPAPRTAWSYAAGCTRDERSPRPSFGLSQA